MDHDFKSTNYLTHQILELKSLEFEIIEFQRQKSTCAFGNVSVLAPNPDGVLDNELFGPRLKSFILLMYYENRLSYSKIKTLIESFSNTTVSKSAIINVIKKCGKVFKTDYDKIIQHLKNGDIIGIDETGWRVCGKNNWLWVFQNENYTAYKIDKSRGSDVVHDTIGEYFDGVLISDFFSVYDKKVKARNKQKCVSHLIRKLEYIYELSKRDAYSYAGRLLNLFRFAVYVRNKLEYASKTFCELRDFISNLLDWYLSFDVSDNKEEHTIQKRLIKYRDEILFFLYDEKVPATNNSSEQAIRSRVIHRKICNGNRSEIGKVAYEVNASILETFKKQNKNVFEEFINLFKSKSVFEPKLKFNFPNFDSS